jgi:hypothetical protein
MSRGGARPRSGPAPDPLALRRERDKGEWTRLPKAGCQQDIPEWPAEFGEPNMRELSLWNRLWRTPQAVIWHRDGVIDMVVVYIRALLQSASPKAGPGILASFRQYSEVLLLTSGSLARERCYIEGDSTDVLFNQNLDLPPEQQRQGRTGAEDSGVVRGRFTVVRPQEDDDDDADPRVSEE